MQRDLVDVHANIIHKWHCAYLPDSICDNTQNDGEVSAVSSEHSLENALICLFMGHYQYLIFLV